MHLHVCAQYEIRLRVRRLVFQHRPAFTNCGKGAGINCGRPSFLAGSTSEQGSAPRLAEVDAWAERRRKALLKAITDSPVLLN